MFEKLPFCFRKRQIPEAGCFKLFPSCLQVYEKVGSQAFGLIFALKNSIGALSVGLPEREPGARRIRRPPGTPDAP